MLKTQHDYFLCYIHNSRAWFTTQRVTSQDGPKWDESHVSMFDEHKPYTFEEAITREIYTEPYLLTSVTFYGENIALFPGLIGSTIPVREMNTGALPWLRMKTLGNYRFIFAGITLANFIREIEQAGGNVYLQTKDTLGFIHAEKQRELALENEKQKESTTKEDITPKADDKANPETPSQEEGKETV